MTTGDARAGTASLTCYLNQDRGSWETYDLQDALVEPNADDGAVSLTFAAVDSSGQIGHFVSRTHRTTRKSWPAFLLANSTECLF